MNGPYSLGIVQVPVYFSFACCFDAYAMFLLGCLEKAMPECCRVVITSCRSSLWIGRKFITLRLGFFQYYRIFCHCITFSRVSRWIRRIFLSCVIMQVWWTLCITVRHIVPHPPWWDSKLFRVTAKIVLRYLQNLAQQKSSVGNQRATTLSEG